MAYLPKQKMPRSAKEWPGIVLLLANFTLCVSVGVALAKPAADSFSSRVCDDFFIGVRGNGDHAAMKRAMVLCQQKLAKQPKHAEALAWQGAGAMYAAYLMLRNGKVLDGARSWQAGLAEMDKAVRLEPNNVAVLMVPGSFLPTAARLPPDMASRKALLERCISADEKLYRIQKPSFRKLSTHDRGELLFALAEAWSRMGNSKKSRGYLMTVRQTCPGSVYDKEARNWLKWPKEAIDQTYHTCVGCHS